MKAEEVLEKVNNDVVIEIMEENGSPVYRKSIDGRTQQECLWFRTICHGGDSSKLCYFSDSHDFFCYTCCGKMSFWDLIKKIRNIPDKKFYEAVKYVAEKVGMSDNTDIFTFGYDTEKTDTKYTSNEIAEMARKSSVNSFEENKYENKIYDDTILRYFDGKTFYNGWINEGITPATMWKYNIKWYPCMNHIIIPHYDDENNLIGIRRRSLNPEDAHNKYMPEYISGQSYEHSLGLNLYGLNKVKDSIRWLRSAVIVEGEKSVLLSDSYYNDGSNAVATCGFNISNRQLELLNKYGAEKIYIGFDKDYDITKEKEYAKDEETYGNFLRYKNRLYTLAKRVNNFGMSVFLIIDRDKLLDKKDSPFDKGKDVLQKLMKRSISYSNLDDLGIYI